MIGKLALLISILVTVLIAQKFLRVNYKKRKHKRNIITGEKIIAKLRNFNGKFRNQQIITYLRKIDPYVFEELILSCLINKGYQIKRNKSYSGDGGLDGIFYHNNKKFLLQVKRYTNQIKPSHLNEFSALIRCKKANGGWFIHTGNTSEKTYNIYRNSNIKIVSGNQLIDLLLENKNEAKPKTTDFQKSILTSQT